MTQYKRWKRAAKFAQQLEDDYNKGYIDFYMKNYKNLGHRDPSKIISDPAVTNKNRNLFTFTRVEGKTTMKYKDGEFLIADPNGLAELIWDIRNPHYGKEVFQKFFEEYKEQIKHSYHEEGNPGWYWSHFPGILTTSPHLTMEMIVEITGVEGLEAFMKRMCISKGPRFSSSEVEKYKDYLSWTYILKTYPDVNVDFLKRYQNEMRKYFLGRYPLGIINKSISLCVLSNDKINDELFFKSLEELRGMRQGQARNLCLFFRVKDIIDYVLKNREFSYDVYKRAIVDGDKNIVSRIDILKNKRIPTSILQVLMDRNKFNLKMDYYLNMTQQQYAKLKPLKEATQIKDFGYKQLTESPEDINRNLKIESSLVGKERFFENEFRKYMAVTKIKNCWKKWYDSPAGPGPEKYWNEFEEMVSDRKRAKY